MSYAWQYSSRVILVGERGESLRLASYPRVRSWMNRARSLRCSLARVYQPGDILPRVETLKEREQRKEGSGPPRGMQSLSLSHSLSFSTSSRYSVNTFENFSKILCHLFCSSTRTRSVWNRNYARNARRARRATKTQRGERGNIPGIPFYHGKLSNGRAPYSLERDSYLYNSHFVRSLRISSYTSCTKLNTMLPLSETQRYFYRFSTFNAS